MIFECLFSDGDVKFFELFVDLVKLGFFRLLVVDLLADALHEKIGTGDDVGALFKLIGDVLRIADLLFVFDLML